MSLEQPGVFYFEDLASEDSALLELFQHGTYPVARELTPPQLKKLRQLTLISMAEQVKSLPYSQVSRTLELETAAVEPFLVEALLEKAVVGKIDAATETLHVTCVATRNASPARAEQAQQMLDSFLGRLEGLIHQNMARLAKDKERSQDSLDDSSLETSHETPQA